MADNAAGAARPEDIVRLIDIRKTYFTGDLQVPVLKGINATVKRGEFVGFIGTSGSGKSTLLNILGMLDVPTGGEYFLEDIEVGQLSDVEQATIRNRKIGFIFQSFNLFPHRSVEENFEVPMVYGRVPGRARSPARPPADAAFGRRMPAHRDRAGVVEQSGFHPGRRTDRQPR